MNARIHSHRGRHPLAVIAGLFVACVSLSVASTAQAQLKVVATTTDLAALVAEVGGKYVSVRALSSPNEDTHYVDPRPSLLPELAKADAIVVNGLDLEIGWLPALQVNARNAKVQVGGLGYFDASKYVEVMEVPAKVDRSMGDIHPGGNPHFMLDPRAAASIATALGQHLSRLAPDHAKAYQANATRVAQELRTLADDMSKRFQGLTADQKRVVTYHRSMVYLIDWLGLSRPANMEPKPGVAPSPGHVARVLGIMRNQGVKVILQERYYPTKSSQTLARLAKAKVLVLPGGADFAGGERYLARVRKTAEEIYRALAP